MIQVQIGNELYYFEPGDPQGMRPGAREVEVDPVVTGGFHHPIESTERAPSPQSSASPAAPAGAPAPQPSAPPSLSVPAFRLGEGAFDAESGVTPDAKGLKGSGPWVRVTPYGQGDVVGRDIVKLDSEPAQEAIRKGFQPIPIRTGVTTTRGVAIPEELTASSWFAAAQQALPSQAQIVGYEAVSVPSPEAPQGIPEYHITWEMPNGAQKTFNFRRQATANGQAYVVTGDPQTKAGTSPEAQDAETKLKQAQAAYYQAQTKRELGQITADDLKNAKEQADQAERAWNIANGFGNYTHKEAIDNAFRQQQVIGQGLTNQNTANQIAAIQQGTVNQTYQNVLQYYRDLVGDEARATELTLQYFRDRANVDANNNQTALAAGRAQVDAEGTANTQRVSLANNRMSAANSGFSDDARTAMDLNQYLQPGSEKGVAALQALQAMRYANAKKYGAFDVNDEDLRFNPEKLPNSIRAFANPANPSFAQYPTFDEMREARDGMLPSGANRPLPPNHQEVAKPPAVPTVPPVSNNVPGAQPRQAAPQQPPSQPQVQARPSNERPDDVLTFAGDDFEPTRRMTRAEYDAMPPGQKGYYQGRIANAESGSLYERGQDGTLAPKQQPQAQTPKPTERPDDVVTLTVQGGNAPRTMTRAEYDEARRSGYFSPEQGWSVQNAESGSLYERNTSGELVRKQEAQDYGQPGMRVIPQPQPSPVEPRSDAAVSYRPVNPPPATDMGPSPTASQSSALLAPTETEEEKRRRRGQELMARYGTPQAIYGLFDGSFPDYPVY